MNTYKMQVHIFKSSSLIDWSTRSVIVTINATDDEAAYAAAEARYPNAAKFEILNVWPAAQAIAA